MDRSWCWGAKQLEFKEPAPFLARLRAIEHSVAGSDLPSKVRNLRTNSLKEWREARDAALFCHGMGQRIGQTVHFALSESQDYDFVASWVVGKEQHLAPVQLKELVPKNLNPNATLADLFSSLNKYVDSPDLTVAIRLNQPGAFEPPGLIVPKLNIAALWIFGAASEDQDTWSLSGNFMEEPATSFFRYPA